MTALSDQLARQFGVFLISIVLTGFAFAQAPKEKPSAVQLTESQKAAIAKQIKDLRDLAKGNILQRHGTAEQAFLAGASDPKKAVELYLRC